MSDSSDMRIENIGYIDTYKIRKILVSSQITDDEKAQFLRSNSSEIKSIMHAALSRDEYNMIIANRPLVIFKPVKNAFTKRGDKVFLANALGLNEKAVNRYIKDTVKELKSGIAVASISPEKIEEIRTYVYRHGSTDHLLTFLNNELVNSNNIMKTLHKNLEYHNGGVADYFVRPIHRMSNRTMINLCNVVDKNLIDAKESGKISEKDYADASDWAIQRIYVLQHNSRLINALKKQFSKENK